MWRKVNAHLQLLRVLWGVASHHCVSFRWWTLTRTWMQLPSQELQATVNNDAKNIASVSFSQTTLLVEASGHLDYFRWAVWRHFMVLLYLFFDMLKNGHHSHQQFGKLLQHASPVNSSVYLWSKKIKVTLHQYEGKWIFTAFLFLCELSC